MPGLMHMTGSLLAVIAMIFAIAFVLRRVQSLRGGAAGAVTLRGGLQVGTRERVLLIEAQGRRVLVGVAPGSVRVLHVFDRDENVALVEAAPDPAGPFAERLKALLRKPS